MKVLVINCGSSSLKYQLMTPSDGVVIARGIVEKIGAEKADFTYYKKDGQKVKTVITAKDHTAAMRYVTDSLVDPANAFINSLDEIDAVGHRVVHGGDEFVQSVVIEESVIESIKRFSLFSPLHNPANLQGVESCQAILPGKKQIAVFDTAFHQSMAQDSYMYALPYEYYEKYRIRRYGFHGTSHRYVSMKAAEFMGKKNEDFNCITCHLGNGSSVAAVKGGKCMDTSMGLTPLEGLVMGTRCGSIDPAIVPFLMEKENLSARDIDSIMNKKSGFLGVSGVSNDFREIKEAAEQGNKRAALAIDLFVKSIRRTIGAYMVELGRVDAIIFTGGIGENVSLVRERVTEGLAPLGIKLDKQLNGSKRSELCSLSPADSPTKVLLVPTNEELMIALETMWVLKGK